MEMNKDDTYDLPGTILLDDAKLGKYPQYIFGNLIIQTT